MLGVGFVQFAITHGGGTSVFNSKWQTVDTMNNTGNSFLFRRTKLFEPWLKMYPWLVYNRNDNFMYCKIYTMAKTSNRLRKAFQGRTFQNVFKKKKANFLDTPRYSSRYLHIPAGASVFSGVPAVIVLLFGSNEKLRLVKV